VVAPPTKTRMESADIQLPFCSVGFIKYGSLPKNYNGMKVYGKKGL